MTAYWDYFGPFMLFEERFIKGRESVEVEKERCKKHDKEQILYSKEIFR